MRSGFLPVALLACSIWGEGFGAPLAAQDPDISTEIRESQRRLEQIREERARLEAEVGNVRVRVRDEARELANVERRLSASRSVLEEVRFQSDATTQQVRESTQVLIASQERLAEGEAVLRRRLRDIYKMGPAHTIQVLLGAKSFTDLLNRYRYLERIAAFDRSLVERVRALEAQLEEQNEELQDRLALLGTLREDRLAEVARLRSVENEHQRSIRQYRAREESASTRIEELENDESRMATLLVELEERRRAMAARGPASIANADAGSLDWPVQGELVYRFGPNRRANGTVIRWNGIGIAAPTGTPVRAVQSGVVVYAGLFEGYGLMVMLEHGNGVYTLYAYLEELGVVQGREVTSGQVVGTVGGADTPEGPHLEFQIRVPAGQGGEPTAQDPLAWLKPAGSS